MGASKEDFTQMREKSLYVINEDQQNLILSIEQMEGEITPEIEKQLEITKKELNKKSIAYLSVITNKEGTNSLIDAEIKRLNTLKKRNVNVVKNLKENLLKAVETFGSFEVNFQKFGMRKSQTVEVEFVNELPEKYKTRKLTETADKIGLKAALKDGQEIEGVSLKTNYNLKIN